MAEWAISLGIGIGLQLLGALITPPTYGPRLKTRKVPHADYGSDIARIRGLMPVTATMIWSVDEYRETKRTRGKIGGKSVQYIYSGDFAYAFLGGPFVGFNQLKLNGTKYVNFYETSSDKLRDSVDFLTDHCSTYTGSETQLPSSTMQAADTAARTPAYRGLAYTLLSGIELTDFGNRPPSVEAIVITQGTKLAENIAAINFRPTTWVSLSGGAVTIANVPDDGLLAGKSSVQSSTSGSGAHSTDAVKFDSSATSTVSAEVEFILKGSAKVGLHNAIPTTYTGLTPQFLFDNTGSTLTLQVSGATVWSQSPSNTYPSGVRLAIRKSPNALTFWVDGAQVYLRSPSTGTFYPIVLFGGTATVIAWDTDSTEYPAGRILPAAINLRSLLSELCELGGLTSTQYDVTGINAGTQILGIELDAGGSPVEWIKQLQALYFFDVYQRGRTLYFRDAVKGASVRTLTVEDLATDQLNNSRSRLWNYKSPNPAELPGEVSLKYFSALDSNFRELTVYSRAETNPSREKIAASVSALLTPSQAQAIADISLHLKWGQKAVTFSLSLDHCDLEPGDIVSLPLYGVPTEVMITKITLGANFVLQVESVTYQPSLWERLVIAPQHRALPTVFAGKFDKVYYALLDTPAIRASDPAGFYWGVGGLQKNWTNAFLNASPDGNDWDVIAQTNQEATMGSATTVLPSATTVLDTTNTVIVQMSSGILSTITTATFNAGGVTNLLLVGDEILRFRDATLIGEYTYRLAYLKRGEKSTPTTGHGVGDRVVLLSTVQAVALEPDQLGVTYRIRLTFDGQTLDEVPEVLFAAT